MHDIETSWTLLDNSNPSLFLLDTQILFFSLLISKIGLRPPYFLINLQINIVEVYLNKNIARIANAVQCHN